MQSKVHMAVIAALATLTACATPHAGPVCRLPSHEMNRVELLFAAATNEGKSIDAKQWQDFLDAEVTPRFPAGLTAYEAYGQWRDAGGEIEKSPSRVLLIWYEGDASVRIDAIREAYKKRFAQDSVMRVDGKDCVSF